MLCLIRSVVTNSTSTTFLNNRRCWRPWKLVLQCWETELVKDFFFFFFFFLQPGCLKRRFEDIHWQILSDWICYVYTAKRWYRIFIVDSPLTSDSRQSAVYRLFPGVHSQTVIMKLRPNSNSWPQAQKYADNTTAQPLLKQGKILKKRRGLDKAFRYLKLYFYVRKSQSHFKFLNTKMNFL